MPRVPKKILPPLFPDQSLGQRVSFYRKKMGLTQKDLADKIGIERTLITDYECGRLRMYDEMLARFSRALNISADILLGFGKEKQSSQIVKVRYMKRIQKIDNLPENKKKVVLQLIDKYIATNS